MQIQDYLERILTAQVYDVAIETRLEVAPHLLRGERQFSLSIVLRLRGRAGFGLHSRGAG
jgi:hypothetical protein